MSSNNDTNYKEMCVTILISCGIDESVCKQLYSELLFEARKYTQGASAECVYIILSLFTDEDKHFIREYENNVDSEAEFLVISRFKDLMTTCAITPR